MSAYTAPTCGYCSNPPAAVCDGVGCAKDLCTVHVHGSWPGRDEGTRYDYCAVCLTATNSPDPIAS